MKNDSHMALKALIRAAVGPEQVHGGRWLRDSTSATSSLCSPGFHRGDQSDLCGSGSRDGGRGAVAFMDRSDDLKLFRIP